MSQSPREVPSNPLGGFEALEIKEGDILGLRLTDHEILVRKLESPKD